jgi:hypothetical protein
MPVYYLQNVVFALCKMSSSLWTRCLLRWQLKTSECHSKRGWGNGNGLTNQNPPLALPTPSHIPLTWHPGTEVVTSVQTASLLWQNNIFARYKSRLCFVYLTMLGTAEGRGFRRLLISWTKGEHWVNSTHRAGLLPCTGQGKNGFFNELQFLTVCRYYIGDFK